MKKEAVSRVISRFLSQVFAWVAMLFINGGGEGLKGGSVTKQDPMGPSWGRRFPQILCFSSALKDLGNSFWCLFPEFFKCSNTTKWKKLTTQYLRIISTSPPDLLAPTDWSPSTKNQKIVHQLITHSGTLQPHLAFEHVSLKPLGISVFFWAWAPCSPCLTQK